MKTPKEIAVYLIGKHFGEVLFAYDDEITAIFEEAVLLGVTQCPIPSPVSDERLKEIAYQWEGEPYAEEVVSHKEVQDLLTHIEHLHRVFAGPEAEAVAKAYDQGYQKGFCDGQSSLITSMAVGIGQIEGVNHNPDWSEGSV